jgi:preprotein translocase subunit SecE
MAQRQKNKKPKVAEEKPEKADLEAKEVAEDALARAPDASPEDEDEDEADASAEEESEKNEAEAAETDAEDPAGEQKAAASAEDDAEGEDDAPAAGQLGSERYVLAGFFAAGMLGAYILGQAFQTIWSAVSNKDWFSQTFPRLAAVADDDKATYSLLLGGVIAVVVVLRTYRRSDIRTWTDEVASELAKVKWPTRKDVSNSTMIVIAASTVATLYLALLDRLWAFVTNIVYGDGS